MNVFRSISLLFRYITGISILTLALSCVFSTLSYAQSTTKVLAHNDFVEKIIKTMTLEQKIGQLFVFGIRGTEVNSSISHWFNSHQPGSIILFRRNMKSPQQVALLNHHLQNLALKKSKVPLFIMVDQEGGSVSRLQMRPVPPSAMALGMTQDEALVEKVGLWTGKVLQLIGINMNLAPVLDIAATGEKDFVGNRAFSDNPQLVGKYAAAFSRGLLAGGVIPTAKHFPGIGRIVQDSHITHTQSSRDEEALREFDLVPYQDFFSLTGHTAIMTAHVSFPKIDPSSLPAAFSSELVASLLREKLNYNGLVLTDDIEMTGAEAVGSFGARAVKAFQAGCDLIMVAWSPKRQSEAIKAFTVAVKNGEISKDRIDLSLRRILSTKQALLQQPFALAAPKNVQQKYSTIVKNLKQLTHLVTKANFAKSKKEFSFLGDSLTQIKHYVVFSAERSFYQSFTSAVPWAPTTFVKLTPRVSAQNLIDQLSSPHQMGLYYVTGSGSARLLNQLPTSLKEKILVINGAAPLDVSEPDAYWAILNLFSVHNGIGSLVGEFFFHNQEDDSRTRSPADN